MKTLLFSILQALCLAACISQPEPPKLDLYQEITAADAPYDSTITN